MKYGKKPAGMWQLFEKSFTKALMSVFGLEPMRAEDVRRRAKETYRTIIAELPEFEKEDRFAVNIISCAMLISFLKNLDEKPSVSAVEQYYNRAMMIPAMKAFCRAMGKLKFGKSDVSQMRQTEKLRAADRNPYSWNMEYLPYADGSGYEARFSHCGICVLMQEYGLFEYVPAMCRLDYAMAEAGRASDFVRRYTLASGGPYCDCGYKRKS